MKMVISFLILLISVGFANTIIQDQSTPLYGFGESILPVSPMGQTFTAEDSKIGYIGFAVFDIDPEMPTVPIEVQLFQGEGIGGQLLGTAELLPSSDPMDLPGHLLPSDKNLRFIEADFSFVTLEVANVYTALLLSSNEKAAILGEYWIDSYSNVLQADPYTGGRGFNNSTIPPEEFDLVFRVTAIPEPATMLLFGLGGILLRKRH